MKGSAAKQEVQPRRLGRVEAFKEEHREKLDEFLDRNGYTAKEVRAIAATAIALWATQQE